MNTVYLRYYIEVCDHGSIAAAANELYMSRQSLTSAINSLECELGNVKLLLRRSSGVEPTEAGKYFYKRAKDMLAALEETATQLSQINKVSTVSIGAPLFCVSEESMKELLSFEQNHPSLTIECRDITYRHSRKTLLDGSLDVGMVYRSNADAAELRYIHITDADFCILGRADSDIAKMTEVQFCDIENATVLFVYGLNYISPEFEKQLMEHSVNIQCIPRNQSVLKTSLKAGKGYHILPRLFAGTLISDEVISRPFKMYKTRKQLCFAFLKDSPKAVAELAEHASRVLVSAMKKV